MLRVWEFKKAKLLWTQTDCVETIDKAERSVKCEMFSKSNSSSNDALYFAYLDLQFKEFSGYSGCIFGIVTHFQVHFQIHCQNFRILWFLTNFQVKLQFENNSSNWLGFALFCKWMLRFDEFFLSEFTIWK